MMLSDGCCVQVCCCCRCHIRSSVPLDWLPVHLHAFEEDRVQDPWEPSPEGHSSILFVIPIFQTVALPVPVYVMIVFYNGFASTSRRRL